METVTALRGQLHELEGDMRSVRGRMEVVEGELRETTTQNSHLTRCLTECQQQVGRGLTVGTGAQNEMYMCMYTQAI